jgi:hypothetical protein
MSSFWVDDTVELLSVDEAPFQSRFTQSPHEGPRALEGGSEASLGSLLIWTAFAGSGLTIRLGAYE